MELSGYVSRLLREHLTQSGNRQRTRQRALDGVLLLVDVAESTNITERFAAEGREGAERLGRVLDRYFGDVFDLIEARGGDVIRIEGDAVLALFGHDATDRSAAIVRALCAAIDLREAFLDWRPELGVRLRHRLALASGRLSAADLHGVDSRSFFVVTGPPIQALADLSHAGAPNEIVLADALAQELWGLARLRKNSRGRWFLEALLDDAHRLRSPGAPNDAHDVAVSHLQHYLPRVLVDRFDAGHSAWLAEFRVVTMVFVSLPGLDVAQSASSAAMEEALQAISEAIRNLGVVLFELIVGDKGVIVLIACGLPPSAPDNYALRAVEAARRVRAALSGKGLRSSAGIATGRLFCGDVGSSTRREYLVTGLVMNDAARLMQAANDEIVVDQATARAAGAQLAFGEAFSIPVKGRSEPLAVHRLDERGPLAVQADRRHGALHGREHEVARIVDRLDAPEHTGARVVCIEAEPGAGKSHLLAHIAQACETRGYRSLWTATSPVEQHTAYYAWRPIVAQLLVCDGGAPDSATLRSELHAAVDGHPVAAKAALIDDILPMGLESGDIRGSARRTGLQDLMLFLISRRLESEQLVIVLDDLHWLDDPSARLFLAIAQRTPRLLIAMATRPLYPDACGRHVLEFAESASDRTLLPRLRRGAIERIVSDVLGARTIPSHLAEFIHARCEGLPVYAEQLALSLRDNRYIGVANGRCRILVSDLSSVAVHDTLGSVILGRIDALEPAQNLAARIASIIGRTFELEMLRSVHPFPADAARLEQILHGLTEAGIVEHVEPGRSSYAFRHVAIQEATRDLLTSEERVPQHRRIAAYIESAHRDNLEAHLEALAQHLEAGAEPERSIAYRQKAAAVAMRRYAIHDALSHLERIERVAKASGLELSDGQKAQLTQIRGDACHELSRFDEAQARYLDCAALAGIRVPTTQAEVVRGVFVEVGRQAFHRSVAVRKALASDVRDRNRLAAHIYTRLAEHAYFAGDPLRILHRTLASLNRAETVDSTREIVEGYGALAIGLGTAGLHRLAVYYRARSLERADSDGVPQDRGIAHLFAAVYSFQAGQWANALEHCRVGADICEALGDRFRGQSCSVIEAYAELLLGRYPRAATIFDAFGEDLHDVENAPVRAWILAGRAILDMALGRPAALALSRLAAARDDSLPRAERLLCDGIESLARLHAGQIDEAVRTAQSALDNMRESAPTVGILLVSISATAEVFLKLAASERASDPEALAVARRACAMLAQYGRKTAICRPRAQLQRGRLALLEGRPGRASRLWRDGLARARALGMPLEQFLLLEALAGIEPAQRADECRDHAVDIANRFGLRPWFAREASLPHEGPVGENRSAAFLT